MHPLVFFGIPLPSSAPLFLALIAIHIPAGLACVVAGAGAMLSRKGRGRHAQFGSTYFWSLSIVFVTTIVLGALRWSEDWQLLVLGALAFGSAVVARSAIRQRPVPRIRLHIAGMGLSYIVLLTAFYVDNGKNLPLWRELPSIAYWTLPAIVGIPILVWALLRHPLARNPAHHAL